MLLVQTEYNPYEAGITYAIQTDKAINFVGKDALEAASRRTPTKRLRCLTVDDGCSMVLGKEPVFLGGKAAGYVTNAAFGYSVRKPIAYAWLPTDVNEGDPVEIEYFSRRIEATVVSDPLHDPQNRRLLDDGPSQKPELQKRLKALL